MQTTSTVILTVKVFIAGAMHNSPKGKLPYFGTHTIIVLNCKKIQPVE